MSLKIKVRERDGVTIMDLAGRIVLGDGATEVEQAFEDLLSQGRRKLIINLASVNYIDSTGLGAFLACKTSAEKQSAEIKLLRMQKHPKSLLVPTRLLTLFEMCEDEEEAVNSFAETVTAP